MTTDQSRDPSRRAFLTAAAASLAAASCAPTPPTTDRAAAQPDGPLGAAQSAPAGVPDGRQRVLLRGGVVLTLDAAAGDFERADVLIEGKRIAAIGPNLTAGDALVVDCAGTIVMPGFITTHHHQYETLQRSLIPDGLLAGAWPQ
jgi:5-methylthioadenosine/S-adenosylhomocysteine deaminase